MSSISAGTSLGTALVSTGDTTGELVLKTNGTTTAVTIGTNQVVTLAQPLPVGSGGTGATSNAAAPFALKGANSDITSLSGLTTALSTGQGGTGSTSTTYCNLASNVTGTLPVANGGTGATTLTANNVLLGNGTSALQAVAPGSSGNVLTSNGTTWTSSAPSGGVTSLNGQTGAITNTDFNAIGSYTAGFRTGAQTTTSVGTTLAGSSILQSIDANFGVYSAFYFPSNLYSNSSLSKTGTWRAVTQARNGSTSCCGVYSLAPCLWVRIS